MTGSCFNFLSKASWPGGLVGASLRADIQNSLQAAVEGFSLLPRPQLSAYYQSEPTIYLFFSYINAFKTP